MTAFTLCHRCAIITKGAAPGYHDTDKELIIMKKLIIFLLAAGLLAGGIYFGIKTFAPKESSAEDLKNELAGKLSGNWL